MKIRFFLLFLSISLSGCSLIYSHSDNLPQRIDQWIAEKKYSVALNTIDYVKPAHQNYRLIQKKKKRILKLIISYENAAIEKSNQFSSQGRWIDAFELLDEVENNIIDTTKIEKHRAKLLKKRNKIITTYENDLLYSQAEYLAGTMELYETVKNTVSNNVNNKLDISEFDDLRQKTNLRLVKRSEQQYKNGRYDNALTAINLALKLKPKKEIILRLNKIKNHIKKDTQSKKSLYVKEAKTLLNKLSQGYSHAILKETKETIVWLKKNKENKNVNQELIIRLEVHFTSGVRQHFEAARRLYSEGKIQEALSIWLDIKKLEPEYPQLQSHIKRAEKVLIKLDKLSNKPQPKKYNGVLFCPGSAGRPSYFFLLVQAKVTKKKDNRKLVGISNPNALTSKEKQALANSRCAPH